MTNQKIITFRNYRNSHLTLMRNSHPYIQYDDIDEIISNISENLGQLLTLSPAARVSIDSPYGIQERLILDLGIETETNHLLYNLSHLLFKQVMRHYISRESNTSHAGISNQMLEGVLNSAFIKETEAMLEKVQERADLAGFVLKSSEFRESEIETAGEIQGLVWFLKMHLDIHIGYKIRFEKNRYETTIVFLPLEKDSQIINQLAINLEKILLLQYSHLDENSLKGLNLSETMILKDVQNILTRAKSKQATREKLLENIDPSVMLPGSKLNQPVYSFLKENNHTPIPKETSFEQESVKDKSIAAFTINLADLIDVEGRSQLQVDLRGFDSKPPVGKRSKNANQNEIDIFPEPEFLSVQFQQWEPPPGEYLVTIEAAKNNVLKRSYSSHPLKHKFLLYPFKSDFEKTFVKSHSSENSLHPKVENFFNRKFARRTSVSHPLQSSKRQIPRRRHYDIKNPESTS